MSSCTVHNHEHDTRKTILHETLKNYGSVVFSWYIRSVSQILVVSPAGEAANLAVAHSNSVLVLNLERRIYREKNRKNGQISRSLPSIAHLNAEALSSTDRY